MSWNLGRVTWCALLVGLLSLDTALFAQQRPTLRQSPTQVTPRPSLGRPGVERASNVQVPTSEGWQADEEPARGRGSAPQAQARPVASQPRMPFALTPQDEANLDYILVAWERQSSKIKTYKCDFTRLEYGRPFDGTKLPKDTYLTDARGELKYSAPDKGMFKVTSINLYNTKTGKHEPGGPENLEHWVCDGRSIFQIDHKEKTRIEQPLPSEMQGQAISDGPLPFVFGAKAAALKQRYWMREIPSPQPTETIWLQAFPRYQSDAANFRYVEIIMGRKDFMPRAIQMFGTAYNPREGNEDRVVFSFENVSFNGRLDNVFRDFVGPDVPFGYKKIVRPAVGQPAAVNPAPPRQNARSAKAPDRSLQR
jgi:TIGR03009 family protein